MAMPITIKIGAITVNVPNGNKLLTASDFTAGVYVDASLINAVPMIDFNLFTNDGSGTLLKVGNGYTFAPATGTITLIPATGGDYLLLV